MFAIFLALFGSFWFAASMILINRGVLSIDYFRGLLANLGINTVFLWVYLILFIDNIDLWLPINGIFVGVGIFVPGVARFFIFKSMERLGATISSCLTNAGPLFAIVIAISFLGEQPTVSNILGAISIVGGIIALSWKGVAKTWRTRDLGFPLAAALLFGYGTHKLGLSPIVGYLVAGVVVGHNTPGFIANPELAQQLADQCLMLRFT